MAGLSLAAVGLKTGLKTKHYKLPSRKISKMDFIMIRYVVSNVQREDGYKSQNANTACLLRSKAKSQFFASRFSTLGPRDSYVIVHMEI